ncbi:MAG: hypothetical protein PVH65_13290, partial [Chloroflexota bacterium]
MNVRRANWKWLALLLALLIVLGACGGEDPTPTSEPTAVPEEPTPVPEEPTAIPEEVEAEPSGDQPAISQPIYRWGEVAD